MGPPTGRSATAGEPVRQPQPQPLVSSAQPSVRLRTGDAQHGSPDVRYRGNVQEERESIREQQPPQLEQLQANDVPPSEIYHSNDNSSQSFRTQLPHSDALGSQPGLEGSSPDMDMPDGPPRQSRVNVTVDVCSEQEVCDSTPDLLTTFIVGRMERDGYSVPPQLSTRNHKRESDVAHVLRDIGDDIMKNYQLNHCISEIQVTPHTAYKTFASVAEQIFSDGSVNWGRIVMLFYFAYKLALQVLHQLPLIDIIIGWVKQFVADRLAGWISSRGGWNAIREYYHSSTTQMVGMFVAGFCAASVLFWYMKKK